MNVRNSPRMTPSSYASSRRRVAARRSLREALELRGELGQLRLEQREPVEDFRRDAARVEGRTGRSRHRTARVGGRRAAVAGRARPGWVGWDARVDPLRLGGQRE